MDTEGLCSSRITANLGHRFVVLGLRAKRPDTQLRPTLVDRYHLVATIDHELRFRIPYALWLTW
jgi:hypothetical protein